MIGPFLNIFLFYFNFTPNPGLNARISRNHSIRTVRKDQHEKTVQRGCAVEEYAEHTGHIGEND